MIAFSHYRASHANGKPPVNNSVAPPAACQVVCHVNMYCLEPIIRQGNLLHTKQWLGYFAAVLEGSESTVHNTKTHMEAIRRFIPSRVSLVPHAGAKPLSFGLKADVVN